ncbi:MAG: ferrous iron transport protein A [Oscillospiraceae bacterium]|nr:ferrous iron transport protein A [Oscillospiraceae bacterium]
MKTEFPLSMLQVGQCAYVQRVEAEPAMSRRLFDLGLVHGTRVACVLRNTAGDLAAYSVRGAVIALRRVNTAGIIVSV